MSTSEIKVILFDLGNVLIKIDFSRVISEWVRFSGKDEIHISPDSILGSENEKYERGEISTDQFVSSLKRELKLNMSDEKFLQGWNNIFVGETPGIRNVIDRVFSKYPLFVFSNTSISHSNVWRSQYSELLKYFDKLFTSYELGMRKPEKESFLEVCSDIGVTPENILFFDDTMENVVAAQEMGMSSVQVNSINDISNHLDQIGV